MTQAHRGQSAFAEGKLPTLACGAAENLESEVGDSSSMLLLRMGPNVQSQSPTTGAADLQSILEVKSREAVEILLRRADGSGCLRLGRWYVSRNERHKV